MSDKNLKDKTVSGLLAMFTSSIIVFLLQFVTTLVLARIFTPEEFGIVGAVTIITSYTDIFWMMGIGPAIVQRLNLSKHDIRTGFTASLGFGIICFMLVYISAPFLIQLIKIEEVSVLRVIAISFIINSLGVIPLSLIQRDMKFKIILIKDVFSALSYGVSAIILGLCGFGVWGLVFALLIKYFVATSLAWLANPIKVSMGFRMENFLRLVNFGVGYTISRFFSVTANQGDYFVIARTLGTHSLGLYNRAYQLMAIPANLMGQVIDQVFFPAMSKIQNENERLSEIFILLTTILATLYLPLSILIFLMSDEIIVLLLGLQWIEASVPLKILALFMFFRVGYKISDPIFRAKGYVYNRALIQIVYAIMVVSFSYAGSPWGLKGITIGVAIALVCNYIVMTIITFKVINFNFIQYLRCLFPVLLVTTSITPIMIYIKGIFQIVFLSDFLIVLLVFFIFSIWFICALIIIYIKVWPQVLKKQINNLILYLFNKLRNLI